MKLSLLAATIGILAVQADEYDETPILILPHNGAHVYHSPPSGGTVRFLMPEEPPPPPQEALHVDPQPQDGGNTPLPGSVPPHDHPDLVMPGSTPDDHDHPAHPDDQEFLLDLSLLTDITKDILEVDFGFGDTIVFNRNLEYDAIHPRHNPEDTNVNTPSGSARGRKLRKRRHRRIQDLISTGDLPDGEECSVVEHPTECTLTSSSPAVDYLPANGYFDPMDESQRFEYFEGTGRYVIEGKATQATAYLKRLKFAKGMVTVGGGEYLSGVINTKSYDYKIRGDVATGMTIVTKSDPATYPAMPPPIQVDDDPDDNAEEVYDENDGSGLPMAPGAGGTDGRRKLKKNLRSGGDKGANRKQQREPNPFDEQIKRQVDHHLEKEKRRRQRQRRTQNDDGSVIDMLVAYTKASMCEILSRSRSCDLDVNDPANHVGMINRAEESVAWTNQAYINSGINTQLRLVYAHFTPTFNDVGWGCYDIIGIFKDQNDGYMDEVHAVRNEWGADMVALLTSGGVTGCGGIAYVGHGSPYYSYAHVMFSVTLSAYAVNAVFAHEVGHNFGCQHDRLNGRAGLPYEYGWQDPEGDFRTIMAYNCPGRWCGRIPYFSNPDKLYQDQIMGNAANDCARKHNDVREQVATYRDVKLTHAPTMSHSPTMTTPPSIEPTGQPTLSPTASYAPSGEPSVSLVPSDVPSEFPTFNFADLDVYEKIESPRTTSYSAQKGFMFDITAKDYDVTIQQFRIPFVRAGDMVISIWSLETGGFWYEKNNEAVWTLRGSPTANSPGITLTNPMPLSQRGGTDYGFLPIVIPAGTTKGIYILVNETSTDANLIAFDRKSGSTCAADHLQPYDFQTWFEDDDMAVSEGVHKNDWEQSVGTALQSFRFVGTIYYGSTRPQRRLEALETPWEENVSMGRRELQVITNDPLSAPSSHPSISLSPSDTRISLSSAVPEIIQGYDGYMFEITAKNQNVVIHNFDLVIYSTKQEYFRGVELSVWTSLPGDHYDAVPGEMRWAEHVPIKFVPSPSSDLTPDPLPGRFLFSPVTIKMGTSVGFYVSIMDPLRDYKILVTPGTSIQDTDLDDDNIIIRQGIAKQWDPCQYWGKTFIDDNGNSRPFKLDGGVHYALLDTTFSPTHPPSFVPSIMPSISMVPSISSVPSIEPTRAHIMPSEVPTLTPAPTYELATLTTPLNVYGEGNTGDGVMFDVVSESVLEVYSVTLGQMADYPMNIHVYSRIGSHYHAYDDVTQWDLIQTYTNFTFDFVNDEDPRRIAFPPQYIGAGETRAFYIAIVETYGEINPMQSGLDVGYDYLNGTWASDDKISIMEGLKFFGISADQPFGDGTPTSGVYLHGGPGGLSYNMQGATIRYRPIATTSPSVSPSTSQLPTESQVPSGLPTTSNYPSLSPSISSAPSQEPSDHPSISVSPSEHPSMTPSDQPSISFEPSQGPSQSSFPTGDPSLQPSGVPTDHPSESPSISLQPSSVPTDPPSESPSISFQPSNLPSTSFAPTTQRYDFASAGSGPLEASYGIMFDVVPNRAMSIETFHLANFGGGEKTYEVNIYTRPGSWVPAQTNPAMWTKISAITISTSDNPIKIPSSAMTPITVYAGQTQSFYIASVGTYFKVRKEDLGTANSDQHVSIYTGRRFYPYDDLFSNSGSAGFRFEGKMIYSHRTDAPSTAPSGGPTPISSTIPSRAPTQLNFPSVTPSLSLSPTTALPTGSPTPRPTQLPTLSPRIQITIPSQISIGGFGIPQTTAEVATVVTIVGPSIAALVRSNLKATQRLTEVIIISINGILVTGGSFSFNRRHLVSRKLDGHIDIEYEIFLEELCGTQTCDDAQSVADAFYESVTVGMQREIDSGAFSETLEQKAQEIGEILELAITSSDFSDLVVVILALSSIWYPAWTTGKYCLNDGEQPHYMKYNGGSWLFDNRDGCCSRYYSYEYIACMGVENAGALGYYPSWDSAEICVNNTDVPDYMRLNPSQWIYDDIDSCCERYYNWNHADCVTKSGGNSTATATLKWYVNHEDEICEQDCPVDGGGPCGGLVPSWKTLFENPISCCENRLSWIATSVCEAGSTLQTATGTSKWYVDYLLEQCVQDCASPGANATCGGVVTSANVDLYDTSDSCCTAKLGWVEGDICEASSTNAVVSSSGSSGWYVDHKLHRCVQDCKGAAPCGGLRKSWDEVFSSSSACCSAKLWWLDSSTTSCALT